MKWVEVTILRLCRHHGRCHSNPGYAVGLLMGNKNKRMEPSTEKKTDDEEVLRNKPDFHRKPWPTISNSAKDFVKKLLVKDPRARLTTAQALCMY
ncbi:calcium-dependent protein kinase 16-like [Quercus lobata]|uniref:Uncharacterized protein n=1 Tax=Quercus lobata TaxID=97700 RepID=A0A7N2LN39_QUELO|nr:calcium-dependent protein kinase 16-like [Quercus lobata]XP_030942452.1 calcium-dependent protein kinase 16-like [Quercus lobata]XP_030968395.1 calcium-dependent protein kinase 16-like [Quercus lobata]